MTDEMGGRLTPDEGKLMLSLFARYCAYDVDQFDFWRIELPNGGEVYVDVSDGGPAGGISRDIYRKAWPPLPKD